MSNAVTAFDHRDDGTDEAAWRRCGLAELRPVAAPGAGDRLVVVVAHPDDETLGAGALIADAARAGAHVTVVIATDGEASHPHSPTHTADRLSTIRREEARAALAELHPGLVPVFLGLPDGHLLPLVDVLTTMVRDHLDGCTHLLTTWVGDRHPDHHACATAAAAGCPEGTRRWQAPIWAWHWDDPSAPSLPWAALRRTEPTADALCAKARAVRTYRSQHTALSPTAGDEAVLSARFLDHFARDAEYLVVDAPAADPVYFDRLYAAGEDPWGLDERFYERRKREVLLAALPQARFRRAFEPGCALGALTERLATRCDAVVAWDGAAAAVGRAASRLTQHDAVQVARGTIPTQWPDGRFDLVVLSEVGYYCTDLDALAARVSGCLTDDGCVVAVHWRHVATDHPHTAAEVHEALGRGLHRVVEHVEADFLLDVWTRSGTSVATAEGIVA